MVKLNWQTAIVHLIEQVTQMLNGLVQTCPGPFPVCHSSSLFPALFLLSYQNKSFEFKNQNSTAKKNKNKKTVLCSVNSN